MQRRFTFIAVAGLVLAGSACQPNSSSAPANAAPGQKQDTKTLAASLESKTTALIDAINAKNDARIKTAKDDLEKEANRVEDQLKSETGAAANRVNAAINRIRPAMLTNDTKQLEAARDLLKQAQQA
jgi:hypothetical protein